ncbi:MAG: dihydroorotate dehydrogenase electron transfer subunit [Chitinispirillaceae bacterium]|jgi:dihydroorotate dehydrogenase electron transfer subunit|nr:dihydroorotate dehydrogenase electron transfer subunit [Chitinispirillaceae bacterium]
MKQFIATIADNQPVSSDFYEMTFTWDASAPEPAPGQFFTVRISPDVVPLLRRPFAFSGFDKKERLASMLYQRRGRGTEILCAKCSGEELDVIGPLGNTFPDVQGKRVILVAGGIGLGPLLFLCAGLKKNNTDCTMVFGCRSIAHLPELPQLAALSPVICTDDGSAGFKGTTAEYLKSIEKSVDGDTVIFACGPAPMLRACHEFAMMRGALCHVSVEQVMACGVGACMGCVVKTVREPGFARACTEGPVFDSRELDWQ